MKKLDYGNMNPQTLLAHLQADTTRTARDKAALERSIQDLVQAYNHTKSMSAQQLCFMQEQVRRTNAEVAEITLLTGRIHNPQRKAVQMARLQVLKAEAAKAIALHKKGEVDLAEALRVNVETQEKAKRTLAEVNQLQMQLQMKIKEVQQRQQGSLPKRKPVPAPGASIAGQDRIGHTQKEKRKEVSTSLMPAQIPHRALAAPTSSPSLQSLQGMDHSPGKRNYLQKRTQGQTTPWPSQLIAGNSTQSLQDTNTGRSKQTKGKQRVSFQNEQLGLPVRNASAPAGASSMPPYQAIQPQNMGFQSNRHYQQYQQPVVAQVPLTTPPGRYPAPYPQTMEARSQRGPTMPHQNTISHKSNGSGSMFSFQKNGQSAGIPRPTQPVVQQQVHFSAQERSNPNMQNAALPTQHGNSLVSNQRKESKQEGLGFFGGSKSQKHSPAQDSGQQRAQAARLTGGKSTNSLQSQAVGGGLQQKSKDPSKPKRRGLGSLFS